MTVMSGAKLQKWDKNQACSGLRKNYEHIEKKLWTHCNTLRPEKLYLKDGPAV